MSVRAGDWVEIRSKEEILRSLDREGRLDGLPFMPQMLEHCGQRFKVYKRAHKTCDTVDRTGGRRLTNAVHLDLRCNGEAYMGCQAACLIFWKEAWLKPASEPGSLAGEHSGHDVLQSGEPASVPCCTEADVRRGTRNEDRHATDESRYVCQATELTKITSTLHWWDIRQYLEDYTSGNASIGRLFCGFVYATYSELIEHSGPRLGRALIWLYDKVNVLRGALPYPRRLGAITVGESTPTCVLNLQPGELVRVKSYDEILATLNTEGKNRGLSFDAEQVPFCGRIFRVRSRVSRFIDERTGKLTSLKQEAVMLDNVWCQARYSNSRMLCPRSIYSWWREGWLERVSEGSHNAVEFSRAIAEIAKKEAGAETNRCSGSLTCRSGDAARSLQVRSLLVSSVARIRAMLARSNDVSSK
jgi:hypothetical protein